MVVQAPHRQFTVDEYYRMAEAGILTPDDRVELIEGEIVQMSPMGSRHAACIKRLTQLFVATLQMQAIVSVQTPVRLGDYSEPEPDFAILKPRSDFYATQHPQPVEVFALVEVSDSSLPFNRNTKAVLYAREGIGEFWIVDLNAPSLEVYRSPSSEGYRDVRMLRKGELVAFQAFAEMPFKVEV
ncbi:MAG: Uma2 family endonuclease [Cyanobacteria bacterium J06597_1]